MNSIGLIKWYIDASYALQRDCKGHTGMMMIMGSRAKSSFSPKQKVNAKNSTEAEFIGMDDALPKILWTRYFIKCQGYHINSNIIYEDNKKHNNLGT